MQTRQCWGSSITLHDQNFTVVGVMPPQVTSPQDTDVWLSLMRRSNNAAWMDRSHHPMIFVWGKLKPGVTVDQARTEMKGIAARLEKTYPDTNGKVYAVVTPLLDNLVGKYKTNLGLLLGAVVLVLLIACANLANLFAARGAARAREFAIHAAVGATRVQIVRKLLVEGFVIALLGGGLGFLLALWMRDVFVALAPQGVARFQQVSFDLPVLLFTFLIALLTTVIFGLWPAWQTSRGDIQLALKEGSAGTGDPPSAQRARDWFVISEIALTLTLFVAAGLVLKSFSQTPIALARIRATRIFSPPASNCRGKSIIIAKTSTPSRRNCSTKCARYRVCKMPPSARMVRSWADGKPDSGAKKRDGRNLRTC